VFDQVGHASLPELLVDKPDAKESVMVGSAIVASVQKTGTPSTMDRGGVNVTESWPRMDGQLDRILQGAV
jgi:hypothetical protein